MADSINIDFEKLDKYIASLKKLLPKMDEPSYKSLDFWTSGATGSGMSLDYLYMFGNRTIDFHDGVYNLIKNTIDYLEEVKKLKDVDQSIADSL